MCCARKDFRHVGGEKTAEGSSEIVAHGETPVVQTAQAQIIILGHTHRPMQVHIGSAQVINPGSIYANYGPYEQTCGILHLPERTFELWDVQTGQPLPLKPILL